MAREIILLDGAGIGLDLQLDEFVSEENYQAGFHNGMGVITRLAVYAASQNEPGWHPYRYC